MTTEREKVALDLIFAALDSAVPGLDRKDVFIRKVSMVLGIAVHLCSEHDIPEELAIKLLQHRFEEYRETMP